MKRLSEAQEFEVTFEALFVRTREKNFRHEKNLQGHQMVYRKYCYLKRQLIHRKAKTFLPNVLLATYHWKLHVPRIICLVLVMKTWLSCKYLKMEVWSWHSFVTKGNCINSKKTTENIILFAYFFQTNLHWQQLNATTTATTTTTKTKHNKTNKKIKQHSLSRIWSAPNFCPYLFHFFSFAFIEYKLVLFLQLLLS